MERDYTLTLISFLYNETSARENEEVIGEIAVNARVNDEYQELMEMMEHLEISKFRPRPRTIERILAYSKASADQI